uniref:Uncharacterized protein n=1 Tax=Arundo donax TaxID=35708 RepID=A0A0A9F412_ARUDO
MNLILLCNFINLDLILLVFCLLRLLKLLRMYVTTFPTILATSLLVLQAGMRTRSGLLMKASELYLLCSMQIFFTLFQ